MNSVVFMPRVMPHIGSGCGNVTELPYVLLTCVIVGTILIIFGILANILHIKFSQGFKYTPIHWADIKPNIDNTVLGAVCGTLGFAFIVAAALVGLAVGVYLYIIML